MDEAPQEFVVPGPAKAAGRHVKCGVCGHGRFWRRRTLMNTPGMSFLGYDWANRTALNLVCEECGHVMWFLD